MISLRRLAKPAGEGVTAAVQIPFRTLVTPHVVRTASGDFLRVWRIRGQGFECADPNELNAAHGRLAAWLRSIASPDVAIWTHVIRRLDAATLVGDPPEGFARQLLDRYRERLAGETLWRNELYLSIVHRPRTPVATGAGTLLAKVPPDEDRQGRSAALDALDKLAQQVEAALGGYGPEPLGTYRHRGRDYSEVLEFLALLINGEHQPMPLPVAPLQDVLATSRLLIGWETLEYRQLTTTRLGAFIGIKEYPSSTSPGLLDRLLSAPFPFVLTQSFSFLPKPTAMGLLARQMNRMKNSADAAVSQAHALAVALDQLASNEFVLGDHHLSLQVLGQLREATSPEPMRELRSLGEALALARSLLADSGIVTAREDIALEPAFWAQLPGNFAPRPRLSPITSRNFCALSPYHNYPSGRPSGNHWGDALAVFRTAAGSAYHFSLHASDPTDPLGGSRRDTGHTFVCGPTGSGKTVFVGFCICLLLRQNATQVIFDKDRGLEVLVRALGGTYLPLQRGAPTGCNPLQLAEGPENAAFLRRWLLTLLSRPGRPLSVREESEADHALAGVLSLERGDRCLSRLLEFLDPTAPDGLHARLAPWCRSAGGIHAWVFDVGTDTVLAELSRNSLVGFDMTGVIGDAEVRGPLTLYLFHLVEQLLDGRRLVAWLDEFSRLVDDPGFAALASDGCKTWRKRNGVIAFATQSPTDVLSSPIARALVEQTPTKILFPNADARAVDYVEGLGLSEQEFRLLRTDLSPGSRRFLIKQARESLVAELDLKGLDQELAVISGRTETVARVNALIAEYGSPPAGWLPLLMVRPMPSVQGVA